MHADEQAAAIAFSAFPSLDQGIDLPPTTKIEVADAKVGPLRNSQRFAQSRKERQVYIVEDPRHADSIPDAVGRQALAEQKKR